MGTDKARLRIGDVTLIERALRVVGRVASEVRLACGSSARYAELGVPLVCDRVSGGGPLSGIEAGLAAAPRGRVIVLACDMPRVDEHLLVRLVQYARKHALDVCALRSERGIEPLCAVWSTSLLPFVAGAIERGELSVRDLIATLPRVGVIDADANGSHTNRAGIEGAGPSVADPLGGTRDVAVNVNTPEDLEREREHAAHIDREAPPQRSAQRRAGS